MVTIFLYYLEDSEKSFEVKTNDSALVMMITRGTLMASIANRATAYDEEGFEICSYIK